MPLLWRSGVVALGAGKSGRYGHTRNNQPAGPVFVAPKIVSGAGHAADLKLEVTGQEYTKSKSGKFGYWVVIKNKSRSDITFKLQAYSIS